ncbi:hypothetical protein MNBD_GAMMA08-2502 [hydrothermal vent metagenome]|uniref:Uncharacterized protein n=1 Tax=hydrothermal vent metagenome TaxID=652676 RepID=A0A3B0X480_9ZZZZ
MNKIDFPIEFLVGDTIEQTLKITIRTSDAALPDDMERLSNLLNAFGNVVEGGGFPRAGISPNNSTVKVTAITPPDALSLAYVWKAVNLDWRFINVLRNALLIFSQIHLPLQSLHIIDITEGTKPIQKMLMPLTGYFQEGWYPEISSLLRFKVIFEGRNIDEDEKMRRLLIDFESPLASNIVDMVIDRIEPWADVVFGGFASEASELMAGTCLIVDMDCNQFDEYTLECVVYEFCGAETAWNPLINMLGSIDYNIAKISHICIE